jgi:hypothetical protein
MMSNVGLITGTTGQGSIGGNALGDGGQANSKNLTGLNALLAQPTFTFAGARGSDPEPDYVPNGSSFDDIHGQFGRGYDKASGHEGTTSTSDKNTKSEDGPEIVVEARLSHKDLKFLRDKASKTATEAQIFLAIATAGYSIEAALSAKLTQTIGNAALGTKIAAGAAAIGGAVSQGWLADQIYEALVDEVLADYKDDGIRNYSPTINANKAELGRLKTEADAMFFPPKSDQPEWGDPDWE